MKLFVGVTDGDWFELLAHQRALDDVNFWQPGGNRQFRSLAPGELFLFKLHSPDDFVVGGGVFAHSPLLPVSLAWETFGIANGARTIEEMRARIEKYRRRAPAREDYTIGCILLEQPFFLPRHAWVPIPKEWPRQAVQGKDTSLSRRLEQRYIAPCRRRCERRHPRGWEGSPRRRDTGGRRSSSLDLGKVPSA